jgi:ABC-type Fe3+/spermidine/putrescine transport system ATPase subunit
VFDEPASKYAAGFFGEINEIAATVIAISPHRTGEAMLAALASSDGNVLQARVSAEVGAGSKVTMVTRPHQLHIEPVSGEARISATNEIIGRVVRHASIGAYTEYLVEAGDTLLTVWAFKALPCATVGATVRVTFDPLDARAFTAAESE